MSKLSAHRAFVFTIFSLLVIYAAWLASIPVSVSVSKVSVRHAFSSSFSSPQSTNVAVPFGVRDGLLFSAVQSLDRNLTASSEDVQGSKISKRVNVPSLNEAVAAGNATIKLLEGHREQSVVNNLEQIVEAGWSILDKDDTVSDEYGGPDGPYQALNIDPNNDKCREAYQNWQFDNCRHRNNAPTGARSRNIYNVPGRAIIADYNFGCLYQLTRPSALAEAAADGLPPAKERIPEIWRWSDIAWNLWVEQAGDAAPTLKYIFRHHIVTDSTKHVIELVAGVDEDDFGEEWPGTTFQAGATGFRALMGTPHGKGIAYMLIDRPYGLRGKNIASITMFVTDADKYNLLFVLTD